MQAMTSRERFARMYDHREADRVPMIDIPWQATLERWRAEGMPADADFAEYFGLDRVATIRMDSSPRFEVRVIEETADYTVSTTRFGVTQKNWKHAASTPQFIDAMVTDRESWARAKERIKPGRDRIDWSALEKDYPRWKAEGAWIRAGLWFGFDVTHSWMVGTERLLLAMVEDPEWCRDMFSHQLETNLALLEMIWDAGYRFDEISWPDDMGYKGKQFFSLAAYRALLKPFHRRAVNWAHDRGVKANLHSCGNINPFVPELVEIGLDALNPLEVKAGMDPVRLKKEYGDRLVLHGGINALLWTEPEKIRAEMTAVIPVLKENGGYIFSSDHSVPSAVSLEEFQAIIELAGKLGSW